MGKFIGEPNKNFAKALMAQLRVDSDKVRDKSVKFTLDPDLHDKIIITWEGISLMDLDTFAQLIRDNISTEDSTSAKS